MAQTANASLGVYDPLFYAQEGLIALEKALGMASRVCRRYDKAPQQKGSTIMIPLPGRFSATDVNTSTGGVTQEIVGGQTSIVLDRWKEVKFALTDKELNFAGETIVQDHIRPAAYALADAVDQDLVALWKYIPWISPVSANVTVADLTAVRKILFGNKVPLHDDNLHLMVSGSLEANLLNQAAFTQYQGAGQDAQAAQMRGSLGRKFGFEIFADQNVAAYSTGAAADATAALTAQLVQGAQSLQLDSVSAGALFKTGDSFVLAGESQRYVVAADATTNPSGAATVAFSPPAAATYNAGTVVAFALPAATVSKTQNLAFHRDAFALAMAPLSEMGQNLGAQVATVNDPLTGLAIRSRIFYDADRSTIKVALDVLYGVKVLNPNLAVRLEE